MIHLGFLILSTDQVIEEDLSQMLPPGVQIHLNSIPFPDEFSDEILKLDKSMLLTCVDGLLSDPSLDSLDGLCFCCTSGAVLIGTEKIRQILSGKARVVTDTASACVRALEEVGASSVAVFSPYTDDINVHMQEFLSKEGQNIVSIHGMNLSRDKDIANVSPEEIIDFISGSDLSNADTIFVSCTGFRVLSVISKLEGLFEKPVVASNQATMWESLRLNGIKQRRPEFGRLFSGL